MLRRLSPSSFAIAAVMACFAVITWRWSWNGGPAIIRSDVLGYYAYLRAVFINHDLGHEKPDGTYLNETPDGTLNKYFAGEAVMLTPFFLTAHGVAHLAGYKTNGLSLPYTRAIGLAALTYALLGLLAFRALLRRMDLREPAITWTLLVIGLGTQLIQYVCLQPGWSHVYSFCMVSVFLLLTWRSANEPDRRLLLAWGASLGLIVLIRPVNGLVLLAVPVVLGRGTVAFIRSLLARWKFTLLAAGIGAAIVFIQCLLWYAQVGHFVADGYRGEGFHWDRPEVFQVLFGVRRGLFVWAPVLIASAACVLLLWRKDRVRSIALMIYWCANTYVIACWWIWYYGSGWGQRVYIDHYPVLFLPLALILDRWLGAGPRLVRVLSLGFLVAASAFTLAQFYQYNHRLLHVECMDSRKYAYSFMRFDDAHRDCFGGNYEAAPFNPNGMDTLLHEKWDVETEPVHWNGRPLRMVNCPSPGHAVAFDRVEEFGLEFTMSAAELPTHRALFLAVGYERYVEHRDDTRPILGIATIERPGGGQAFYRPFPMEPMPPRGDGVWEHIEYRIQVPPLAAGEYLKFYFWNETHEGRFRADDLDMTVMAVRPY